MTVHIGGWVPPTSRSAEKPCAISLPGITKWHTLGALDLYDMDPRHLRAGVAIHIAESARRQGHGLEGLRLLLAYARHHLGLRQVYAEIPSDHAASTKLFEMAGFAMVGNLVSWIRAPHGWQDVSVWQCLFDQPFDP
jgi:diamine N-acetyltransferase